MTSTPTPLNKMLKKDLIKLVIDLEQANGELQNTISSDYRDFIRVRDELKECKEERRTNQSILKAIRQASITMIAVKHPKLTPRPHIGSLQESEDKPNSEEYNFLSYILKLIRNN